MGVIRPDPLFPCTGKKHAAWETLAGGAGGFVSIPDGGLGRAGLEDRRSLEETRMRRRGDSMEGVWSTEQGVEGREKECERRRRRRRCPSELRCGRKS